MSDAEQLSALIGSIYDTALQPEKWPNALAGINRYLNGKATLFGLHDAAARTADVFYSWGDDPKYTELYFAQYARLNPTVVPLSMHVKPGEVFSISTVVPYDEFCRTRMYLEWVEPQGYGDATHVLIEKSATSFAHLGTVHRPEDSPAGEEVRARMRLLAPHICRAVAISKILDFHKTEAATLSSAIDQIAAGIFLVRGAGEIAYANAAARTLLDEKSIVREIDGSLTVLDRSAEKAFREALSAAASGDGLGGQTGSTVALSARDGSRFVAHILSLAVGDRRQVGNRLDAAAAVFLHQAGMQTPTLFEAVAHHFKLSPSELRVLFAIVEVGGVPEVATVLGVSEETVRTHLKHLFAKTGTNRQANLVRLIAAYANPLIR
jgi:DNA-binding CsgD family transcriptional regulator